MQAFACDLDGTLIGREGILGPRTRAAIRRSKEEGVRVLVATGRMFRSARRYLDEAGLDDPVVCYQGAAVVDPRSGEFLLHEPLDLEVAREVIASLGARGLSPNVYVDDQLYVARETEYSRRYSAFQHLPVIEVGDLLSAEGPRGDFVLDRASARPVVLLAGGVGLTPLVSMLHALAATDRRVFFIHACENGEVQALRDEIEALASSRPGLTVHFCHRFPTARDRESARFHSEGVVTRETLQALLPLDDYDFYLCGPPAFMQAVYGTVRGLGVPKHRIAYEFFGPATVLEPAGAADAAVATASPARSELPSGAVTVEFRKSGLTAVWDDEAESLLAFAEEQGLSPGFSCRAGICSTCKSRILEGEVAYFEEPLDEPGAGEVLLCCSKPKGAVVLDI